VIIGSSNGNVVPFLTGEDNYELIYTTVFII
jgi:hypothetical protein